MLPRLPSLQRQSLFFISQQPGSPVFSILSNESDTKKKASRSYLKCHQVGHCHAPSISMYIWCRKFFSAVVAFSELLALSCSLAGSTAQRCQALSSVEPVEPVEPCPLGRPDLETLPRSVLLRAKCRASAND